MKRPGARKKRPTTYSDKVAAAICAAITEGKSIGQVCADEGFPDRRSVYRWLQAKATFRELYSVACMDRADTLASEIVSIADEPVADSAAAQRNRLRCDARRFIAARLHPRRWGDERIELTGPDGKSLATPGLEMDDPRRILEFAKRIAFVLAMGVEAADELKARGRRSMPLQLGYEADDEADQR